MKTIHELMNMNEPELGKLEKETYAYWKKICSVIELFKQQVKEEEAEE